MISWEEGYWYQKRRYLIDKYPSIELIDNLYSELEKAINNEEYEVAAKIRDRIKQIDEKLENK